MREREHEESCKEDSPFLSPRFNQRHLCKGSQLSLGGDLSGALVKGAVFEVQENYHVLPITVPGMENARGSVGKQKI